MSQTSKGLALNKFPTMQSICFVMPFHISERGGGAEVQAWLLARNFAKRGFEVSYIAQTVSKKPGSEETIDNVKIFWLKHWPHFHWLCGWQYYRALKNVTPDVLIQRTTSFITGVAGVFTRLHGKQFAWICTDDSVPFRWMFSKKQREANHSHRVGIAKGFIFLANACINDLSHQLGMRFVTHAFTQNNYQRQNLKKSFRMLSHSLTSGHEVPRLWLSPKERFRKRTILWVANLGPRKQPEKFIELARSNQKKNWRFVMIGDRLDQDYVRSLFRLSPENLEWLGKKSFESTLDWFDRATVFINTSKRKSEGFPNTFIQSWLRGVPVITLGVDPDGVTEANSLGYVVADLAQMTDRIQHLFSAEETYVTISNHARAYAKSNHSVARTADVFLNAFA